MTKTLILGDITLDIISSVPQFPITPSSILSPDFLIEPGGNANTMIAASRFGASVIALGNIGKDIQGSICKEILQREHIDLTFIQEDGETTSVITLSNKKGKHVFVGKRGKGENLSPLGVETLSWNEIELLYLTGYSLNDPRTQEICLKAIEMAHEYHSFIVMDIGPEFIEIPTDIKNYSLEFVDILLATSDEIPFTGYSSVAKLLEEYPSLVIIEKQGSKGCMIHTIDGEPIAIPAHKEILPVDTSGAGDSFAGGLLAGLSRGWSLREATQLANCLGEVKVQKFGCGRNVPTFKEVIAHIIDYNIPLAHLLSQ